MARSTAASLLTGAALALLAGCSAMPDTGEGPVGMRGGPVAYPALVPLGGLLAAAEGGRLTARSGDEISARAARLNARAAALRGGVVDDATRRQMQAALLRHER